LASAIASTAWALAELETDTMAMIAQKT